MLKLKYAIFANHEWYLEYKKRLVEVENNTETKDPQKTKLIGKDIAGIAGASIVGYLFPIPALTVAGALFIKGKIKDHRDIEFEKMLQEMGDYEFYSVDDIPPEFVLEQKPEPGMVFVSCNYKPNYYYPVAVFQEKLAQIKEDAIYQMMKDLGAKTITFGRNLSKSKTIEANVLVDKVKSTFKKYQKDDEKRLFKKTFKKPTEMKKSTHPYILDNPFWSQHQNERFEEKASSLEYTWAIEKETALDGNLAATIQKMKLNIGGKYKAFKKEEITYFVDYWDF